MKLRQWNAKVAGLAAMALLVHFAGTTYMYLTYQYFPVFTVVCARILAGLMILHVLLSLIKLLRQDRGAAVKYPKLNARLIIQRASAILTLILFFIHDGNMHFMSTGQPISMGTFWYKLLITYAFYAVLFTHIALSMSRACITFGDFRTKEAEKKVDIITFALCGIFFVLGCYAVTYVLNLWPKL